MSTPSDISFYLNNWLNLEEYIYFEESIRPSEYIKSYIPSYDSFKSYKVNLGVNVEELKARSALLNSDMFLDNWLYINKQGISIVYLNILCKYAKYHFLNEIRIPEGIDVIVIKSQQKINYRGNIIFNKDLKAITSHCNFMDNTNEVYIYMSNILMNYYKKNSKKSCYFESLDLSLCENFDRINLGSFFNIKINKLILNKGLNEIEEGSFNKKLGSISGISMEYISPKIFDMINNVQQIDYVVLNDSNIKNLSNKSQYISDTVVIDGIISSYHILYKYPICYCNFKNLYMPSSNLTSIKDISSKYQDALSFINYKKYTECKREFNVYIYNRQKRDIEGIKERKYKLFRRYPKISHDERYEYTFNVYYEEELLEE